MCCRSHDVSVACLVILQCLQQMAVAKHAESKEIQAELKWPTLMDWYNQLNTTCQFRGIEWILFHAKSQARPITRHIRLKFVLGSILLKLYTSKTLSIAFWHNVNYHRTLFRLVSTENGSLWDNCSSHKQAIVNVFVVSQTGGCLCCFSFCELTCS